MAGGTSKEGASKEALVIDTNIIISSMIKESGYTRTILITLTEITPSYTPEHALKEIEKHAQFLAKRKGIPLHKQEALIKVLTSNIEVVGGDFYKDKLREAKQYVKDPGDIDFAALALKLRERYEHVSILTWNTRDYRVDLLEQLEIRVLTPANAVKHLIEFLDSPR